MQPSSNSTVKRQIVLDTETTGLDPAVHRIIEVGCIELENRLFTRRSFHHYVNPERLIDAGAFAVHGISNQFLANKPLFKTIAEDLLAYLQGAQLIIHNAPFDLGFLDAEFARVIANFTRLTDYCTVIDTLPLARRLHPSQRNSLDALCKRYKIDNSHRDLHGALKDAQLLGEVYLRMTGGQMRFNLSPSQQPNGKTQAEELFASCTDDKLVVLKASKEEKALHHAYLAWLRDQGECLWEMEK